MKTLTVIPSDSTEEDSSRSQNIEVTRLSTVKLSTVNADHLQQRWTRPLPLKLTSLPLTSGAFLRLAFYARCTHPPHGNSYTVRFKVSVVE